MSLFISSDLGDKTIIFETFKSQLLAYYRLIIEDNTSFFMRNDSLEINLRK